MSYYEREKTYLLERLKDATGRYRKSLEARLERLELRYHKQEAIALAQQEEPQKRGEKFQ